MTERHSLAIIAALFALACVGVWLWHSTGQCAWLILTAPAFVLAILLLWVAGWALSKERHFR